MVRACVPAASALVAVLAFSPPLAAADWMSAICAAYDGELLSGSVLVDAVTEFVPSRTSPGTIAGRYAFKDPSGQVAKGTLEDCKPVSELVLTCQWTDRYGAGPVRFAFFPGLGGFRGAWGAPGEVPRLPWNGTARCRPRPAS